MNYGTTQYGLVQYAETVINSDEVKKYFVDLTKYVPPFIWQIPEMKAIYDAQGAELGSLYYYIDDLLRQCFINTATWSLYIWEEEYAITTILEDSYEVRRSRIIAKKRGIGTVTIAMIKNVAESFKNGEVDVIEDDANYAFTIKFISLKGIPPKIEDIKNAIEEIKPAHLAVNYLYLFNTHLMLKQYKQYELTHYTHKQLRESELAHILLNSYDDLENYTYEYLENYTCSQLMTNKII